MTAIDSRRYLTTLRHWWWLPFMGMVTAAAISYAISDRLPRVYEGRATLLVDFTSPQSRPNYNDAQLSQHLVKTYAQMAIQPVVLEQVGPRLGIDLSVEQLAPYVSAQPVRDSQLFAITARAAEPGLARDLANATAEVFIADQDRRLVDHQASGATSLIQPARLPLQPVEPRTSINVAVAVIAVLLLGLGFVYLRAWFDDTVKTPADAERAAEAPTLGVIPEERGSPNRRSSQVIEAYRLVRTAIDFARARQPLRTLLVTSAGQGEGKSTVSANLAAAMARAGSRVILVDGDLRSPSQHHRFGMANDRGLTMLLADEPEPLDALLLHVRPTTTTNLSLLTAGPPPPSATEMLQSESFRDLLRELQQHADVLVFDSPPALSVADGLVLAGRADAALIVVAAGSTQVAAVRRLRVLLAQSGTRLLGTVLNRAQTGWEHYEPAIATPLSSAEDAPTDPLLRGAG